MKKLFIAVLFLGFGFGLKAQTIITFYTNLGSFEVELYDTIVPITTQNIKDLVNAKYYDGVIFHRIISNFVIQGGDPTGTGSGGPGYTIQDEFDSTLSNTVKTLSMANSGPNTGGSQFFINLKNNVFLDYDKAPLSSAHPVFGIVISGWDTVEMIEAVPVNGNDRPVPDVVMDSVRVTQIPLSTPQIAQNKIRLSVFPNPVNNASILAIESKVGLAANVQIMNLSGVVIQSKTIQLSKGFNSIPLNNLSINKLPKGMYLISVSSKDFVRYIKIQN